MGKKMKSFPLLLGHDVNMVIGNVLLEKDENVEMMLFENDYKIDIGYQILKEKYVDGVRIVEKIKLFEISLVEVLKNK